MDATGPSVRRAFILAWALALLFYVLEYATRSAPAVMLPELQQAFGQSGVGVSNILGSYYYTYSLMSLVAGVALDRAGAKYVAPLGCLILAVGCLLFSVSNPQSAYLARLLQGAGSAFAFTAAVYLAARGFSSRFLATAIGLTQCLGMLGGSAGQFIVGPLIQSGVDWRLIWYAIGNASLIVAIAMVLVTPSSPSSDTKSGLSGILSPYKIVLSNPQSYLCGLVAGLMFAPTTIGAMTWGVAFFQHDRQFAYGEAVVAASVVPLGWAVGSPLMGWLADRIGLRKPVVLAGAALMFLAIVQITFIPGLLPAKLMLFLLGIVSGAAMIPYSIIKEANPDNVKGSATGTINFITFGVTALVGPVFAALFGRTLISAADPVAHFRHAGSFWLCTTALAIVLIGLLRETGMRRVQQ